MMKKAVTIAILISILRGSTSESHNFRSAFRHVTDDMLGASKFQDVLNKPSNLISVPIDTEEIASGVARSVISKFNEVTEALEVLRSKVTLVENGTKVVSCCRNDSVKAEDDASYRFDPSFQTEVNKDRLCQVKSQRATDKTRTVEDVFLNQASTNLKTSAGLKWQYFGTEEGTLFQYPSVEVPKCDSTYDPRFRQWYVQGCSPKPKDIVLVIDTSSSMKFEGRIDAVKEGAATVVSSLTPNDRVGVVVFANSAKTLGSSLHNKAGNQDDNRSRFDTSCFDRSLVTATPRNTRILIKDILKVKPEGETYYSSGLKIAFDLLKRSFNTDSKSGNSTRWSRREVESETTESRHRIILFLSDGEPTDTPNSIFKLIHQQNEALHNSVVILTYALGPMTFGAALRRMSLQQFGYESNESLPTPTPGVFQQIKHVDHLRYAMGSFYSFFLKDRDLTQGDNAIQWSVPYYDAGGLGIVMTAALPIFNNDSFFGVLGTDILMDDLFADAAVLRSSDHVTYGFLVDVTGRTLYHPFLPYPDDVTEDPVLTDIAAFERDDNVVTYLRGLLDQIVGGGGEEGHDVTSKVFEHTRVLRSTHGGVRKYSTESRYSCSGILQKFMFCVVCDDAVHAVSGISPQLVPADFEFLYHRLDLSLTDTDLCQHEGKVLTYNHSSIKFSPAAYQKQLTSMHSLNNEDSLKRIKQYEQEVLVGGSRASNVLKDGVRDTVLLSWNAEKIWKEVTQNLERGTETDDILWRYVGFENGVFRIWPGTQLPDTYDHTERPWYHQGKALAVDSFLSGEKQEGRIAVSVPYTDAASANLVITLSTAVTEPVPSTESLPNRPPHVLGVMGIDITIEYLKTLLTSGGHGSSRDEIVAIDLAGYILYDQDLLTRSKDAIDRVERENYHILNSKHTIGYDLLRNGILVQHQCVDVASVSFRNGYHVNRTRIEEVASSLPFHVTNIEGTNVILLEFNQTSLLNIGCIGLDDPLQHCQAKQRSGGGAEALCTSPCVDWHGAANRHYDVCSNRYSYSWQTDPPACIPNQTGRRRRLSTNSLRANDHSFAAVRMCYEPPESPVFQRYQAVRFSSNRPLDQKTTFVVLAACGILLFIVLVARQRRSCASQRLTSEVTDSLTL